MPKLQTTSEKYHSKTVFKKKKNNNKKKPTEKAWKADL